jgi:hypothetical protein
VIQDLVSNDVNHLKRLCRCYGIYEHIAVNPNKMLRIEDAVFILEAIRSRTQYANVSYLASCVNDFGGVLLSLILDDFTKSVLDRWIIALYKVPIHKTHCERRFSWVG